MATTSTLQCCWFHWKNYDVLCSVFVGAKLQGGCLCFERAWACFVVLNEMARFYREATTHSRYWIDLFLYWGLVWSHSRIFNCFWCFPHSLRWLGFRYVQLFSLSACRRKSQVQTFETQERSCELLLQGGVGGGPEVFSTNSKVTGGLRRDPWSGGSIADQEYTRLGDVGPRGSYCLLWHGAKLIRSSAQGRRNRIQRGKGKGFFVFNLEKRSWRLNKLIMKQIDTMTCTRCNYPTYFKHVLDAWFHATCFEVGCLLVFVFSTWQRA